MKRICRGLFIGVWIASLISRLFSQAGAIDPTFDPGGGSDGAIFGIALQPDGKIIAVGAFTQFNGVARNGIVRLNADGSIDQTFNPGTGANGVFAVAFRNSKIVIGGNFSTVNGEFHAGVARLNLDGSVDSTFHGSGGNESVGILSDDKVIIGGVGGLIHHEILRFLPNGDVDESFTASVDSLGQVYCVAIQPDDKTLFGGDFMSVSGESRFRIARANADGTLDETFLPEGGSSLAVYAIAVRTDGKIYQGGYLFTRINADGSIDHSFTWSQFNGTSGYVSSIDVQQDGKPIIGGNFTSIEDRQTGFGTNRNYVARLNNDGSIDESFGAGESLANNSVEAVAVQPDGRIVIGGFFTAVNGVARSGIARLLGDTPILNVQRVLGGKVVASWPSAYSNWLLQATKNEKHRDWETVTTSPTVVNGMNYVTSRIGQNGKFYRLVQE